MDKLKKFILNSDPTSVFDIYFPVKIFDNKAGDLNISKKQFDLLLKSNLEKYGRYNKTSKIIYSFENKTYTLINKKNRLIQKNIKSSTLLTNKYIIVKSIKIDINQEFFPVIDKYHDICKQNMMTFKLPIGELHLITQSYEDQKCTYFYKITFENKDININTINNLYELISSFSYS